MIFISRTDTHVHVWLKHNRKVTKRNINKLPGLSEADAESVIQILIPSSAGSSYLQWNISTATGWIARYANFAHTVMAWRKALILEGE